ERELEIVLALAVGAALAPATAAPRRLRLRQRVPLYELLVAGQHMLAIATPRVVVEARFLDALLRDMHHFLGVDVAERALLDRAGDGFPEGPPGQPDEALPVGVALPFRVEPAIDDVHARGLAGGLIPPC